MKKIITFMVAMLAWAGVQAEEKTVWQGNEAISWNTEVAPGTQFETPEGIFTGLQKDNTIRIYTTTTYDDPQYVVTYKAGDGWEWTDLTTTITDGVISYTVENDDIATWIAERGLVIRGQAYSITRITVDAEAPQPVEGEQTVWEGNEPISWNTEVAPGTQYELTGIFASLAEGDVLRFYTTATIDEPQYVVTYKAGDGWEWTDLTTSFANDVITYVVENDQIATEIADRGIIMRGQGYNLTKVTIAKAGATTIVGLKANAANQNDVIYNMAGQRVNASYKGVIILNGRKYVVK